MKSIILTGAEVEKSEQKILRETNIFKLALNQHAEEYKPNERIITDYILSDISKIFPEKIISVREKFRYLSQKVSYPDLEFKGSTLISAVEYLIQRGFDEILITGDNKVHSKEFQNLINKELEKISSDIKIYQYKNGNFNLPVKRVKDFLNN